MGVQGWWEVVQASPKILVTHLTLVSLIHIKLKNPNSNPNQINFKNPKRNKFRNWSNDVTSVWYMETSENYKIAAGNVLI